MNLSKQIKKYRKHRQFSQEELAEKIYVSRQTISNWENERSYPDIHNLLLLSVLFDVSLDELVKGDVEAMKQTINHTEMQKWTYIMLIFTILAPLSIGPSIAVFGKKGLIIFAVLAVIMMYSGIKLEILKKKQRIKTYTEIVAFIENREVSEEEIQENRKKDLLKKIALVAGFGIAAGLLAALSMMLFR